MKKIAIALVLVASIVFTLQAFNKEPAKIHNEQLSKLFLSKHIPIIDIRTKKEWERTGIVKNSILLTFYDENGRYNEEYFLRSLNSKFNKKSEFAILCRSGNRSNRVTRFLKSKGYENVINLAGGIKQGHKNHIEFVKYTKEIL